MRGRPFVTVNFALTADGRASTRKGTPADFPSKFDKRRLLEIRATGDALLVGARTLATDNMSMGLPADDLRAQRLARGQAEYPLRVILTNSGRINPELRVFSKDFSAIHIFSTERMPKRTRVALEAKATLHLDDAPAVDLPGMLRTLHREHRIRRIVCEGGPAALRSLLVADLIDELHVTFCPRIFGGTGAPTLTGPAGPYLPRSTRLALRSMEVVDDECFLRYRVLR